MQGCDGQGGSRQQVAPAFINASATRAHGMTMGAVGRAARRHSGLPSSSARPRSCPASVRVAARRWTPARGARHHQQTSRRHRGLGVVALSKPPPVTGMMRDSSSVRLIWSLGRGPSTGGWEACRGAFSRSPPPSPAAPRAENFEHAFDFDDRRFDGGADRRRRGGDDAHGLSSRSMLQAAILVRSMRLRMLADYAAMDSNDKGSGNVVLAAQPARGEASVAETTSRIVPKSSDQGEPPAHPDPIAELVRIRRTSCGRSS